MPMTRNQKHQLAEELKDKFNRANAAFIAEYRGSTVEEMGALRGQIFKAEGEVKVLKNRVAKVAAKGTPFEGFSENFKGPVAVAFSFNDPVSIAKAVMDLSDNKETPLKLLAGSMDAKDLSVAEVKALSALPDRQTLLGMVATVLAAPVRDFACVMAAVPRDFANVLNAVKDKKEQQ